MNESSCGYEDRVAAAVRDGRRSDELRAHFAVCAECRELASVAQFMSAVAARMRKDAPLREARVVWLEAQLAERRRRAERALLPIEIARVSAIVVAAAALMLAAPFVLPFVVDAAGELGTSIGQVLALRANLSLAALAVGIGALAAASWRALAFRA